MDDNSILRRDIQKLEQEIASYTLNILLQNKSENDECSNNYELENLVRYIASKALLNEAKITSDLLGLQDEIAYFVELNNRFKTVHRLREKIIQKMKVDKLSCQEAADGICDSLRYTLIIDDSVYTEKVDGYLKLLESFGYKVIKFKNAWGNEYYKGINVSFITDNGFKFELQFHTPNGFAIKEGKLRDVYNIIRDPNSPSDLKIKANMIRKYYQAQVKIPKGAIEYTFQGTEKRI